MIRRVTNSFNILYKAVSIPEISAGKKIIVGYEGSSRSSKTRSIINFLLLYSEYNINKGKVIRIFRDERANCMGTVYEDFIAQVTEWGQFNPSCLRLSAPTTYNHFGNRFIFMGCDEVKAHGASQDVAYFNEALDINQDAWRQINMRTSDMTIMDWNPKVSDHWVFDLEKRDDCIFLKSTFKDNALIPPSILKEILAYDPNNPVNIEQGTADDYMWKVYGLGLRCAPSGLIFPNVTWIDEFPADVEREFYGMDFGWTVDPTALVKVGVNFRNIYLQNMLYTPCDNAIDLANKYLIHVLPKDKVCWCDKGAPGMIGDLRNLGFTTVAAEKWPGCIIYRADVIKRYKIHIVKNADFRKEQENYRYRVIQGITLNEPVDAYNHLWDATGYACQHELR